MEEGDNTKNKGDIVHRMRKIRKESLMARTLGTKDKGGFALLLPSPFGVRSIRR
jgi:hypothetical protein